MKLTSTLAVASAFASVLVLTLATGCHPRSTSQREGGDAAFAAGDHETALMQYRAAAEANPSEVRNHYNMGRAYLELDRPVPAEGAFRSGLAVSRKSTFWRLQLTDGLAESLFRQPGQQDALFDLLADAVERFGLADDHIRRGEFLQRIGDSDNALAAFEAGAGASQPGDARSLVRRGDFFRALGDDESARTSYRYAYYVNPQYADLDDLLRQVGFFPGPTAGLEPPVGMRPLDSVEASD